MFVCVLQTLPTQDVSVLCQLLLKVLWPRSSNNDSFFFEPEDSHLQGVQVPVPVFFPAVRANMDPLFQSICLLAGNMVLMKCGGFIGREFSAVSAICPTWRSSSWNMQRFCGFEPPKFTPATRGQRARSGHACTSPVCVILFRHHAARVIIIPFQLHIFPAWECLEVSFSGRIHLV